ADCAPRLHAATSSAYEPATATAKIRYSPPAPDCQQKARKGTPPDCVTPEKNRIDRTLVCVLPATDSISRSRNERITKPRPFSQIEKNSFFGRPVRAFSGSRS